MLLFFKFNPHSMIYKILFSELKIFKANAWFYKYQIYTNKDGWGIDTTDILLDNNFLMLKIYEAKDLVKDFKDLIII